MKFLKNLWSWLFHRHAKLLVRYVEDDTPPDEVQKGEMVVAKEEGVYWAAAFLCPCGCKEQLEVALIPEVRPHWRLFVTKDGKPTLHPSVWRRTGCKSHFWIKNGETIWCSH